MIYFRKEGEEVRNGLSWTIVSAINVKYICIILKIHEFYIRCRLRMTPEPFTLFLKSFYIIHPGKETKEGITPSIIKTFMDIVLHAK